MGVPSMSCDVVARKPGSAVGPCWYVEVQYQIRVTICVDYQIYLKYMVKC